MDFKPVYFNCYFFLGDDSLFTYRITYEKSKLTNDLYKIEYSVDAGKTWAHDGRYKDLYDSIRGILIHLYSREKQKPAYYNITAQSFEVGEIYSRIGEGVRVIGIIGSNKRYDETHTFGTNDGFQVEFNSLIKE